MHHKLRHEPVVFSCKEYSNFFFFFFSYEKEVYINYYQNHHTHDMQASHLNFKGASPT